MEKRRVIAYEFGPYRLLPVERRLLRRGETVALTPKVFDTLLALVEHSDRLLAKDELMKTIWQDSFVEEGNLTQNIFILRKILGESRNDHQYIVTIPGQGYRFVAEVREIEHQSSAFHYHDREGAGQPAASEATSGALTSLAVLPFMSLYSEGDHAYLGPGIADTLITRLSNIKRLVVRPTTSVLKYIDAQPDPLRAGRELGVDAVLDGRIQKAGERIRVTMQLIRIRDGQTLWAEKFDEKMTDIFEVQDSISEQVMRALAVQLTSDEQRLLTKRYTESIEAFQLYIKGRHFWNKRTVEGLKRGMVCAQQAIDIDPTYTLAYIGLADTYNLLAGYAGLAPKETFPKARAAALRAQEIDATLAEAEASLAFVAYRYEWSWQAAEERFRRSIRLRPDYPTAHHWYGEFLAAMGRYTQSIAELERAQQLDPLSLPINTDLGQSLYFARQYDDAIAQLQKTLEMDQDFVRAHIILGAAFGQQGMHGEAVAALSRAREMSGENHLAIGGLGYTHAVAGRRDEAMRALDELQRLSVQRYVSPYTIALIHLGLADYDRTLEWLWKAYESRDVWLVWLLVDPRFDALHADARCQELLRSIGLASPSTEH